MNHSIAEPVWLKRLFARWLPALLPDFALLLIGLILIIEYKHLLLFHHLVIGWLALDGIVERFERPFLIRGGLWAVGLALIDFIIVATGHVPSNRLIYVPLAVGVIGTALYMANRERRMNRMRDELADMVVHDMKGPLQVIVGYTELLLDAPEQALGTSDREAIAQIKRSSQALLNMTMMLLDIERIRAQRLSLRAERGSIDRLFEQVCQEYQQYAAERGVRLKYEACEPGKYATLDWGLIRRVVENLLLNAIKHSPYDTLVIMNACIQENVLQIDVVDQGEGIATTDQKFIFERFTQSAHRRYGDKSDTGLGLSFCKMAVEAHRGKISLVSEVGHGSTFTVRLPLQDN